MKKQFVLSSFLFAVVLIALLAVSPSVAPVHSQDATPTMAATSGGKIGCTTDNAFGTQTTDTHFALDLLCKPVLLDTLTVEKGNSITVTVNLASYAKSTGQTKSSFIIHFAMTRASINIKGQGETAGTNITDATDHIKDIPVSGVSGDTYDFTVTNNGLRSAIFDVSVRLAK